jgi:uncharacterized protein YjgD (DUF1641 family)
MQAELAALNTKVDALTQQVTALTLLLEEQRQMQRPVEELVAEAGPLAKLAMSKATQKMAEMDGQFTLEMLAAFVQRLMLNLPRLNKLLDLLEAGTDLLDEAGHLSKPLMATATATVADLERRGYFAFAQEGQRVMERVVTEFSPEDVRALGDNIVTILTTVRNMTQPDIMALANNAVDSLHAPEPSLEDATPWALMREVNDPQVRKGLARLLRMVKSFAEQPNAVRNN